MINSGLEKYSDINYLKSLASDSFSLSREVENSQGLVLYWFSLFDLKPSVSFFKEHFTPFSAPFFNKFYPELKFTDFAPQENPEDIQEFSPQYRLKKELSKQSLDALKKDTTVLAQMFLDFRPFSRVLKPEQEEFDYSVRIRDFISIFRKYFKNLNDMEEFFDKRFFDYIFENVPTDKCFWGYSLSSPQDNVFVFALKSYLLDIALYDWHKNNAKARRLYARLAMFMADKQNFFIEPKFSHRIIPNLLQTNTLDILCEQSKYFFENTNPVYIKGLVNKAPTINLMIALIYYLKVHKGTGATAVITISQCLNEGLSRVSNEDTKIILNFMNYSVKRDSDFYKEDNVFVCNDSSYNAIANLDTFMDFVSPSMVTKINPKCIDKYLKICPETWKTEHILAIGKSMTEKKLNQVLFSFIEQSNSLFDFSPQIISFMIARRSITEAICNKFSNDLEKIFNETLALEQVYNVQPNVDFNLNEYKSSIDLRVLQSCKFNLMKQDFASDIIEKIARINLQNKEYDRFYTIVNSLKKSGEGVSKIIKPWKEHIKDMPVTDLLVNSRNKFFVKSMYLISLEVKITFYKVGKEDAKNILKELSAFFLDKSIPLAWLPNALLSWKEQSETVPGILMTKYQKSLNKNIEHKLSVNSFKEMVVGYFDDFLTKSEQNDGIYTSSLAFNPLFVNQHLKSYTKNLPKLLKTLEDRPEYYVLVALNSYPEMAGTLLNRIKFLAKMNVKDFLRLDIKNIINLDFDDKYNLAEEQFLFLKHNVKVDWEICFKGIVKLVNNVYWTAKNKEIDIQAKHISSLIANTFWQFRTLYSFETGISQNENVNYTYLLSPSFFYLLKEDKKLESLHNKKLNLAGKDNFITSLLKHIRYEFKNNDENLLNIFSGWLDSMKKFQVDISPKDEYCIKSIYAGCKNENIFLMSAFAYLLDYHSLYTIVRKDYLEENNIHFKMFDKLYSIVKTALVNGEDLSNASLISNDTDSSLAPVQKTIVSKYLEGVHVALAKEVIGNHMNHHMQKNSITDECDTIEDESFKI